MTKVAIIGLGAVGSFSALLVSKWKIDKLILIDRDFVESSNIPHQILYSNNEVGSAKAHAARTNLSSNITSHVADIDANTINLIKNVDIVLDCTDNFETRFLLNDYCHKFKIPWIYSAAIKNYATVMPIIKGGPCFNCVFQNHSNAETCSTAGVTLQAAAAAAIWQVSLAKNILDKKIQNTYMYRLSPPNDTLKILVKNKKCNTCRSKYTYLTQPSKIVKLCGTNAYQIKGKPLQLNLLSKNAISRNEYCVVFKQITVFRDGRAIVRANSEKQALKIYRNTTS